jgi:hypothetical protein
MWTIGTPQGRPAPGRVRALRIVYDPEHATRVGAGENQGARLTEYRIVRSVETLAEWDGASRTLATALPAAGQGLSVLVQSADLRVIGAADLSPTNEPPAAGTIG